MPKEKNRSLNLLLKKAASLATMASMLSSMLNLGMVLPVKAQYIEAEEWIGGNQYYRTYNANGGDSGPASPQSSDTLASLTSFINSPAPSAGNDESTNVSYAFTLGSNITFGANNAFIKIATNNSNNTVGNLSREQWDGEWVTTNNNQPTLGQDIQLGGPISQNITVSKVEIKDFNSAQNTLYIELACNTDAEGGDCGLAANVEYSIDLLNNPLIKPDLAGPHRQLFIVGNITETVGDEGPIYTESGAGKMTINSYYKGLTVSASVDARLVFQIEAASAGTQIGGLTSDVESESTGCNFGTLVPEAPIVCMWNLSAETNAKNGLEIYVVQDTNMTYSGSGATIKQFANNVIATPIDQTTWTSPVNPVAAHLGYTSNDTDVFGTINGVQTFAGIPSMNGEGVAATDGASLVADSDTAGELTAIYANKIETNSLLEQAPAALGQSYGHTQYFIVVGKF